MKRIADDYLVKWKSDERRKPLLIRGARQIGKTFTIAGFGKNHFENFIKIDFEREPGLKQIFDLDLNPRRICNEIEIIKNIKIVTGKTLLFFDEIQECGNAIMSLRYFYEEMPELHIIATGSLLEFALSDISFPVGRIQFYNMFPLNFSEYLAATGKENLQKLIDKEPKNLSTNIHELLNRELKNYFFIGGMPECVKTYIRTNSIVECSEVQSEIINSLRMDFSKYSPKVDKDCLNSALSEIARNVGNQTKYSSLAQGFSNPTLKKAYQALLMAKLINQINAVNPIGFPAQIVSGRIFKTSFLDIGLMNFISGITISEEYFKTDLLSIYRGSLAEQFVAQEFAVNQSNNLYYWSRQSKSSTAEVDYVIQKQNKWIPVEVKSGSSGSLRSMHRYLDEFNDCNYGIILSSQEYKELPEQKLIFMPIYFAGIISKNTKQEH